MIDLLESIIDVWISKSQSHMGNIHNGYFNSKYMKLAVFAFSPLCTVKVSVRWYSYFFVTKTLETRRERFIFSRLPFPVFVCVRKLEIYVCYCVCAK